MPKSELEPIIIAVGKRKIMSEETYNLKINKEQMLLIRKLLIDAELDYRESIEREVMLAKMFNADWDKKEKELH